MVSGRRARIMIVDDSAVMRSLLRSVVCADAGLEVAGTAADGASALDSIATLHPDLILLDVEMPVMDGLVTLKHLRARGYRMPVIMCSSLTQRGASVTIEALAGGASDYVAKPAGQETREAATRALAQDLIPKIHALTGSLQAGQPQPALPGAPRMPLTLPMAQRQKAQPISSIPEVLAIGVSTGGPAALDVMLPVFPENFPLPVVIVQHMPEQFTGLFAERLNGRCRLRVREAVEGDPMCAGIIYIARGNWHLEVLAAAHAGMPVHATPEPRSVGESLPSSRRRAVSIGGSGLWNWCACGSAHRHGFRRIDGLPHDSRTRRQRSGPGPGQQHDMGNAGRWLPMLAWRTMCFHSRSLRLKSSALQAGCPPLKGKPASF